MISWATTLGAVVHAGARLGLIVSVAYPAFDIVVLTITVLLLSRSAASRRTRTLLGFGLVCMTLADSAFAYLTAAGRYHTGDPIDLVWMAAFALIALAGYTERDTTPAWEPISAVGTGLD